jgi:hypothetical protein
MFGITEAGGRVKNDEATVGRCGLVIEKFPHLYPVPHDQDLVASVRVSKGCTTWLVCIGYVAYISCYLYPAGELLIL